MWLSWDSHDDKTVVREIQSHLTSGFCSEPSLPDNYLKPLSPSPVLFSPQKFQDGRTILLPKPV